MRRDVDHESTPAQYMVKDRQELVRYLISRGCQTDLLMSAAIGDGNLVRRHLDANPDSIRMRVSNEYFPMINPRAGGTIYQWTLGFYLSAHQVARKFGHEDVLQLLMDRSPAAVKLIEACWLEDEAFVQAIRSENPDIADGLTDSDRRQVAHAARNNKTTVVRLLLESGLPSDATSQHQATPLHWAAFHGNLEMTNICAEPRPESGSHRRRFPGDAAGLGHSWFRERLALSDRRLRRHGRGADTGRQRSVPRRSKEARPCKKSFADKRGGSSRMAEWPQLLIRKWQMSPSCMM